MASLIQVRDLLALQAYGGKTAKPQPAYAAADDRCHAGKTGSDGKAIRIQEEPDGVCPAVVNIARKGKPVSGRVGTS